MFILFMWALNASLHMQRNIQSSLSQFYEIQKSVYCSCGIVLSEYALQYLGSVESNNIVYLHIYFHYYPQLHRFDSFCIAVILVILL